MIYLDNAATTFVKPSGVRAAVIKAFDSCANAGRGGYDGAMTASEYMYTARTKAAELFGVKNPEQVVFTQNATHSLNIAIKGSISSGNVAISGYEHNSVVRPIVSMEKKGVTYSVARGRLFDSEDMLRKFSNAITVGTKLAVCTHISNVFGYILPIKEIDNLCFKKGIPLIIDASQSAGSIDIKLSELRATIFICAPGHKGLYGPQGTGLLICRDGKNTETLIEGGTGSASAELEQPGFMPDRFESGTQNIPGIAGLSEGIEYVKTRGCENIFKHEKCLIGYTIRELAKMSWIQVYSARDGKVQGGVLSFNVKNMSAEAVAQKLSEKKIAVRSGLHCSPFAHKTVGTERGTVRVSVSDFTTESDIMHFLDIMRRIKY